MTYGRKYIIEQKLKLHTKPLKEICIKRKGTLIKCTEKMLTFKEFKANKKTIISIKETE